MSGQSRVLQKELPEALEQALKHAGLAPREAWLCVDTDLNLASDYEQVFLCAEADRLYTAAVPTAKSSSPVRLMLTRESIREIRTRQGVGGGFLEALVEGIYVEVLAFSNARSDVFHKVAPKLRAWCEKKPVAVGAEDDVDTRRCPKCGLTLAFPGDLCQRCLKRSATFFRVLKLMRPYAGKAAIMMALVLAAIGLAMVPQKLVQLLIDGVLSPHKVVSVLWWHFDTPITRNGKVTLLLLLIGVLMLMYLITAVLQAVSGRLSSQVGTRITYDMRKRVFDHLVKLGVDFYDRYSTGQMMTRVAIDTQQMQGFVQQLTSGLLAQLIQLVVVGVALFTINWELALYTLVPAPFVVVATRFFWKKIYPHYYRVQDASSKLHGALNTILSGIRVVKAFGQEPREEGRFDRSNSYVRDREREVQYAVTAFHPKVSLLFQAGSILVWYIGGLQVIDAAGRPAGGMTTGDLLFFFGLLGMFWAPLTQLTQLTNWLTNFLTASQRVFEILDTNYQVAEAAEPKALPAAKGAIVFENVSFGYNRREPVIKNVSFSIAPGEHIGVVGKSGSGKTTLINLLTRFYDVDEGRILVDGIDIRQIKLDDLRRNVGIVLQEPFLFRGGIWANIAYGRTDATPELVLSAAKAANAHEFIMRHPLGYDTYVGERGAGLSGGERQRVSIARALLYDPPILVLDEATSNIDTESEQLIQGALARVTAGRTTLAIAHRLSTLRNCNRIIVIDGGTVAECGTHDELMAGQALYYRLVKIQTELSRGSTVDAMIAGGQA
ncbi:MAG: ABC transporter ATP-binding protein/permease [Planctomycetaceae bacterium]|nr:ABC transporter ATP-binding protein/permease [Planctomycetaceae bacterium]